jgi:hypothetical protein
MIKLGSKVQDKITGFTGIVTCRAEFLYGCVRLEVQPEELFEGKIVEAPYIDEKQLEVVREPSQELIGKKTKRTYGPRESPTRHNNPLR